MNTTVEIINQHLIDPEVCIRCNTCEATCPVGAITHDSRNYVVDASKCNLCMACVPPCPTGSIDNWREVTRAKVFSLEEQLSWDELPPKELSTHAQSGPAQLSILQQDNPSDSAPGFHSGLISGLGGTGERATEVASQFTQLGSVTPPWSAAHPYTQLYGVKAQQKYITATVTGNVRVTQIGKEYDTHHIILDFGAMPFPVLEGQSIGIIPPGSDNSGRPHHARQYSVASPRNGERVGYNNLSLTVKRVLEDYAGKPIKGVASNYLCDLKPGDLVQVIGPFGSSFLMPNHPGSNLVMICTGTGSAPMRAMTEWRRRLRATGKFKGGELMLFFGARTKEELPYFGPLKNLPAEFIDLNFAFSRDPDSPKTYVQDVMRQRGLELGRLLKDPNTYFYVCGLRQMEQGVLEALKEIAELGELAWPATHETLKREGRLHFETY